MRGLPYSGKSTRARELAGDTGRIHSANDFFMVDGLYRYCGGQVRRLHQENQAAFKNSIEEGTPVVILDNCHTKIWQFKESFEFASNLGYGVEIVAMPHYPGIAAFRKTNWRNIPHQDFMRMYDNFENFTVPVSLTNR